MATIGKYGKIIFSDDDIQFIKDNFQSMTNKQIASKLRLKLTSVRNTAYSLGLKRMTLEPWTDEAVIYLKANYHKIGDREMCRYFDAKFPKEKGWTSKHIQKKMSQLGLKRNKIDWFCIKERNRDNGSFGNKNLKNQPSAPKVYFYLNPKTRIEIKPGQTIEQLKLKYNNYNTI